MKKDFEVGMKVSLNGEFGVVVDSGKTDANSLGIIRWDINSVSDFEDWTGLFGTFIDLGGKILDEKSEFKFINDDGSLKQ